MADLCNNIPFTWQLVSQFVSWEFCRYMSENNECHPETDVLAFLRNMIVQRTEKSVTEATKHEIIAKFIMELKAIKDFEIASIIPLSESVKTICPELSSAVSKLVHHLETFFNVLESTDERRKELIRFRIEDSISDFSKEASRLLPKPDLLQVVNSWNHTHIHPGPKPPKKAIYNAMLFERVLECLHIEGMTASEAKIISIALNEDKVFENILRSGEAEPETEADSEQFTLSQSSQPVYSQEFIKNTQATKSGLNLSNNLPHLQAHSQVPLLEHNSPLHMSDDSPVQPIGSNLIQNEDPPDFLAGTPPSPPPSPPEYPFIHRNISNQNAELQKSTSHMQFAQSSANESDDSDASLHDRIQAKFQQIREDEIRQDQSDTDTSDCDKNPQFKILTPTYFKKGNTGVIYVSDMESNNSSIMSIMPSSQQADPNWSRRQTSLLPATQYVRPKKKPGKFVKRNSPIKKYIHFTKNSPVKRNIPARKKKPIRQISSSDSDENPGNPIPSSPYVSPHRPSTSGTRTRAELGGPLKKRRLAKALYRSPTLCIDDFVSVLRKSNSESLSEISVPNVTKPRKAKKAAPSKVMSSSKKQKCKHCNKTYKTEIALRRHIFLKHTEPPEDSDCDT